MKNKSNKIEVVHNDINKINSITQLLETEASWIFFDLEDTLWAQNKMQQMIKESPYRELFLEICNGITVFDVIFLGKNFRRTLIEPISVEIVKTLQSRFTDNCSCKYQMICRKPYCACKKTKCLCEHTNCYILTSGFPSKKKKERLYEMDFRFDDFIFTSGKAKGPVLCSFLKSKNFHGKCAFVDNDIEKIKNVQEYFIQHNRPIDLFVYEKVLDQNITNEEFIKYWVDVKNTVCKKRYV